jgi:hypothetical protein
MNRNDFLNMIENSVPVNRELISEVYDLINIFPYFQSAHMLLLKGLQNNADIKFESQLRNSAIHIADREVLYYLLNTSVTPVVEKTEFKQTEPLTNSENKELTEEILLMSEEPAHFEEKVIYLDPEYVAPVQSDLLELDLDENTSDKSEIEIIADEPQENDVINSKKLQQSQLIDKFIIANPRIETNKDKSDMLLEDISRPSVEEEGSFVTETLAKIYINQGYYSKAIEIYKKLSLKFPEKSSYFASQIEKVTEYIKK